MTQGLEGPQELPQTTRSLVKLAKEANKCKHCGLWRHATQTVFGEGPARARIMLVGEQPGNDEDLQGRPFVGPAGQLMDRLLVEAGIDRNKVYVTNAVKHFKWEPHGKRRIHKKPSRVEIAACRSWLDAEIAALKPEVIVCLGATAARALLGRGFRVTVDHGRFIKSPLASRVLATIHPSAILRAPDEATRHELEKQFSDLEKVARWKWRDSRRV
jgi:uracil-DNA glycosylase family protein